MQADRRDRNGAPRERDSNSRQTLILIAAALVLAAIAYLLLPGEKEPEEIAVEPEPAEQPAPQPPQPDPAENIAAAPDIPEPEPEPEPEAEPEPEPEPPPPPTPQEIDATVRGELTAAGASTSGALGPALTAPFILDRGASAVDQIARGYVPGRALNLPKPSGTFAVRRVGQQRYVDEQSYARYDRAVSTLTALEPEAVAVAFQNVRPMFAEAYAALGYPADKADNALVAALDAILAVPVIREPLAVESKGALWAYSDPALESRSDLDKQLLRLGPDNLELLQRWARDVRDALLQ